MKISNNLLGHLSGFGAYFIFGFNIIICKDLSNSHLISPIGLFCIRSTFTALLFWLVSVFMPYEEVEKSDLLKIFLASMLGLFLTQTTFLKGITLVTPFDTSILTSITPIFTMFVAAVALKEPITLKKTGGVFLAFMGVILLITNSVGLNGSTNQTEPLGVVLIILNAFIFALYLGIFRPLIAKYHVITFMKWMFLFSMLVALPFGIGEFFTIDYASFSGNFILELLYMLVFATFIAYFLIPVGQKYLRPTVISLYSYLQPLIASVVSVWIGMDVLSWQKIVAACAVFIGVILVNKSRSAKNPNQQKIS